MSLDPIFGGSDGINHFAEAASASTANTRPLATIGPVSFSENDMWIVTIGWILVVIMSVLVFMLVRSPWGRVIKAIRRTRTLSGPWARSVYAYKMQALIIGGVMGCFGGFIAAIAFR
ncbi:MAG: hypothetical protein R2687_01075 [Candidatus Nanopelagicales bacterium]